MKHGYFMAWRSIGVAVVLAGLVLPLAGRMPEARAASMGLSLVRTHSAGVSAPTIKIVSAPRGHANFSPTTVSGTVSDGTFASFYIENTTTSPQTLTCLGTTVVTIPAGASQAIAIDWAGTFPVRLSSTPGATLIVTGLAS